MPLSQLEQVEVAKAYVALSNAHALAFILPMFSDSAHYQSSNVGEFKGRDTIGEMMTGFFVRFPDVNWQVASFRHGAENRVEFDFSMTGCEPVTGNRIERCGLEQIEFNEEGFIERINVNTDQDACQPEKPIKIEDLQAYADAWNAHDIDRIMSFMAPDCVFETGGGSEKHGTRHRGYEEVKARFIEVWTDFPDVRFENPRHFVRGDRGCSEWTFVATRADGTILEIDGCDLFTFIDDKIQLKNSYIKNRT
jgi:ketosteroid isomerase-like protein